MSAALTTTKSNMPVPLTPNFAFDDSGMPIYLGQSDDEIGNDWDEKAAQIDKDHWEMAAIAATIVTKYGQNNVGTFAEEHGTSAKWIRALATAYRTFEKGRRIPNLSISHHIESLKAKNPVRAAKIAHDRHYSVRELKAWIYKGEGRNKRLERAAPSAQDEPIVIEVEAEDADSEDAITIEDEDLDSEDRQLLLADLQMILRMCRQARDTLQTKYAERHVITLEEEIDWEIERLTKMPSALPERVEVYIRGGYWIPAQIMAKAKIGTLEELNRICLRLEKQGKIKLSREGKRAHGTAPDLWMPVDMPDGGQFQASKPYQPTVEYEND